MNIIFQVKTESPGQSSQTIIIQTPTQVQTPQQQTRTPTAGGTIWKASDYLLEKELLKFALEHRQVEFISKNRILMYF